MLFAIAASISLWLLCAVVFIGRKSPGYDPVRDTISALAERGARFERGVSYGVFLPTGIGAFVTAWMGATCARDLAGLSAMLLALSIAVGYGVAAFTPWDPAAYASDDPLRKRRFRIHIFAAVLEYAGASAAFAMASASFPEPVSSACIFVTGVFVVAGFSVLNARGRLAPWYGALQRALELLIFLGWVGLSYVVV